MAKIRQGLGIETWRKTLSPQPAPHGLSETVSLHSEHLHAPTVPRAFGKDAWPAATPSPGPLPRLPESWLGGAGGKPQGSAGQGRGREGGAEVEAASLLRAALATHPFSRDKGTEALQWLLFSQTAVPAGGGWVEGGWALRVRGGCAL